MAERRLFTLRGLLLASALIASNPELSHASGVGGGGAAAVATAAITAAVAAPIADISTANVISNINHEAPPTVPGQLDPALSSLLAPATAPPLQPTYYPVSDLAIVKKYPQLFPALYVEDVEAIGGTIEALNRDPNPAETTLIGAIQFWQFMGFQGQALINLVKWMVTGSRDPIDLDHLIARNEPWDASILGFANRQAAGFPEDIALAYAMVTKAPPPPKTAFEQRWTVWGTAYGGYNRTDGDPTTGSGTLTARVYGSIVGIDYHFTPYTQVGFSLGGAGMNWGQGPSSSGSGSSIQLGVNGATHAGPAYIAAFLNAATSRFNTTSFIGADEIAAKFDAEDYSARLEGGYRYSVLPRVGITPYAALQFQYFHTPNINQADLSGGGMGISTNAMDATDTRSELGARFDTVQIINGVPLVWRARAAWAHDWYSNTSVTAVFPTLPGTSFILAGAELPTDSALASLEAELHLTSQWSLAAKFDSQLASTSQTYAGIATLRFAW